MPPQAASTDKIERLIKLFAKSCGPYHYSSFGFPHRAEVNELTASRRMRTIEHDGDIRIAYVSKVLKNQSTHTDFRGKEITIPKGTIFVSDIAIAEQADDKDFFAFAGAVACQTVMSNVLAFRNLSSNTWIEVYQESPLVRKLLDFLKWSRVCTKIMAGSEIKGLYCSAEKQQDMDPVDVPAISEICRDFLGDKLAVVRKELARYLIAESGAWENHYSIYNTKNKWAAFALQGFSPDPTFIIKPAEMSRKWKADNERLPC